MRSIKHVAMENRLYPMRELLGELLLEAGQPKDALAEFTQALKQTAEPLSRALRRGAGRRGRRRCGERQGVLRDGHQAVATRRRAAPRTATCPGFRRFEVVHSSQDCRRADASFKLSTRGQCQRQLCISLQPWWAWCSRTEGVSSCSTGNRRFASSPESKSTTRTASCFFIPILRCCLSR